MAQTGHAHWEGDLKNGKGRIRLGSGAFEGSYSFKSRFEGAPGTTPEELLGAAHAGCFTMALSFMLNAEKFTAEAIDTEATLTMDQVNNAWTVTAMHLTTRARVPEIDAAKFAEISSNAKATCPISRLLNATITLDAALVA